MASEVARLRQQIADEYLAAKWGLSGLALGTSQHNFITARMENMGQSLTTLIDVVGSPQEAAKILADTLENLPDKPIRSTIVDIIRHELETTEETSILIEHIEEMWETMDLLKERFGFEIATKIISTPALLEQKEEETRG